MSVSQVGSPIPKAGHRQKALRVEGRHRFGRFAVASLATIAVFVVAARSSPVMDQLHLEACHSRHGTWWRGRR